MTSVNFSQYKTYAFHKSGIDRLKYQAWTKRILNAIDYELGKKA
jgi:hypothetical protein